MVASVLFAITLAATVGWFFTQRRSHGGTAASTGPAPTQPEGGNAGYPMTSTQQQQPGPDYKPQMGEQYPQGHGLRHPQAPGYKPSTPQGQYPPQAQPATYQTGAPAQY